MVAEEKVLVEGRNYSLLCTFGKYTNFNSSSAPLEIEIFQVPSSNGLGFMVLWRIGEKEWVN